MIWQEHIHSDKNILLGKHVIKGTRLSVEFIIQQLATGWTEEQILENYPQLTKHTLQAMFFYILDAMQDGLLFNNQQQTA